MNIIYRCVHITNYCKNVLCVETDSYFEKKILYEIAEKSCKAVCLLLKLTTIISVEI